MACETSSDLLAALEIAELHKLS